MSKYLHVVSVVAIIASITLSFRSASSSPDGKDVKAETYKGNVSYVQSATPSREDRNIAANFSWIDSKGTSVSLKDLRGKVVFINFWGTWCRPCRMELPDIVSLVRQYEGDVAFIGVAMERGGGDVLQNLLTFTKEQKMAYQIVVGNDELAAAYGGLSGIPTTFVIDKNGKIVGSFVGMRTRIAFEELIKKAL